MWIYLKIWRVCRVVSCVFVAWSVVFVSTRLSCSYLCPLNSQRFSNQFLLNTTTISPWPWSHQSSCPNQTWTVGGSPENAHVNHSYNRFWRHVLLFSMDDMLHMCLFLCCGDTCKGDNVSQHAVWMCCDLYLIEVLQRSVIWLAVIILQWVIQTCALFSHISGLRL